MRPIALVVLALLIAAPLEAQSLRDRFSELFTFGDCGEPLRRPRAGQLLPPVRPQPRQLGVSKTLKSGDMVHIPAGAKHIGRAKAGSFGIDIFNQGRIEAGAGHQHHEYFGQQVVRPHAR